MKKVAAFLVVVAVVVAAPAAQAQMGVGTMWVGGGIRPALTLPIMMGEDMVFEPTLQFLDLENLGTIIAFGASIEKHMNPGGTSGLFGVTVEVEIFSPDGENAESQTAFGGGVFVGGTADLADNVAIVGQMGIGVVGGDALTTIGTVATVTLRWWVFGN